MSKIFEGLNKAHDELPELVRPLLEGEVPLPTPTGGADEPLSPASAGPIPRVPPAQDSAGLAVRTQRFRISSPSPVLPYEGGNWHASEQYRILRTKILQSPAKPRMIVVSSPGPGDGKTVTALNLAAALSLKNDSKVLLMDGDFRRSSIHVLLGLPPAPGLAEVLVGTRTLEDALVRSEDFAGLYVLPAGVAEANPAELLDSPRWRSLAAAIRNYFQYIIVDSPPVAAVTDYDLIQASCDGVLLVMRPDHTKRSLCFKAIETVPKEKLIGIVLNSVPEWFAAPQAPSSYYYYTGAPAEGAPPRPPRVGGE